MGDLVYEPPREGLTLWEIGFPDRSAAEFYIPDPDPKYANDFLLNDLNRLVIVISRTEFLINTSILLVFFFFFFVKADFIKVPKNNTRLTKQRNTKKTNYN